MTRKLAEILFLSLLMLSFLAVSAFGISQDKRVLNTQVRTDLYKTFPKAKLAGADQYLYGDAGGDEINVYSRFGYDNGKASPDTGVGKVLGYTTYDYQHNGRMTRQVGWRGTENVHFAWMKKNNDTPGGYRVTSYQLWDADDGALVWDATTGLGGISIHPQNERSGYCGVDVMSDGRGLPYNHYNTTGVATDPYRSTLWPDDNPGEGDFGPNVTGVPDALLADSVTGEFIWPYVTFQLYNNDTIMHVVAGENEAVNVATEIRYFRRLGGPTDDNESWDDYMIVDNSPVNAYVVEAAGPNVDPTYAGKVAIVWVAHLPATPGGNVSTKPTSQALLVEQNMNDIYYKVSTDGGENWSATDNITEIDSTVGGWVCLADVGAVIDTAGQLHVVWAGRNMGSLEQGATGANATDWLWPLFPFNSRIFHWTDAYPGTEYITIVQDGSWDWTTFDTTTCWGGAWHSMSLNHPQISQCDTNLYVTFNQFHDLGNQIWRSCSQRYWDGFDREGSAQGNIWMKVATVRNAGLNWDPARMLTAFTGPCDTIGGASGFPECHSHFYHSMAREGMYNDYGDFGNAVVIDPGGSSAIPDMFLDIMYIDDMDPGGVIQGEGGWTISPVKWFRVPCLEPVSQPDLALEPTAIDLPSWNKPGVDVDTVVTITNIGNAVLTVSSITAEEIEGPSGWLTKDLSTASITEQVPNNYEDLTITIKGSLVSPGGVAVCRGRIILDSDAPGQYDTIPVGFIVADTVQFQEYDTLVTENLSLSVNNDGNIGGGGAAIADFGGQMDFFLARDGGLECDTTLAGDHNHAETYLFEASPFICRIEGTDTLVSAAVHSMDWIRNYTWAGIKDGMVPQEGLPAISNSTVWNYAYSGKYYSADSAIVFESEYLAPADVDTSKWIAQVITMANNTDAAINGIYLGEIADWDIPSDSLARNGSNFDATRKLMYLYGFETPTQADTVGNNDCAVADQRYGGTSWYYGWKKHNTSKTMYENPQGLFTGRVAVWLNETSPTGHLVPDSLYRKLSTFGGYEPWTAQSVTGPESLYQDLVMFTVAGQFDLDVGDTVRFVKYMASEYQGGLSGLQASIDEAVHYGLVHGAVCCRAWGQPGDVNLDNKVNILDIVGLINYKYKDGKDIWWPGTDTRCRADIP